MKILTNKDKVDIQTLANVLNGNNRTKSSGSKWEIGDNCIKLSGVSPSEGTEIRNELSKVSIVRSDEKVTWRDPNNCGLICIVRPEEKGTVRLEICRWIGGRIGKFHECSNPDVDINKAIRAARLNQKING